MEGQKQIKLEGEIIELRGRDYTAKEMARELGEPTSTIKRVIHELLKSGRLSDKRRRRKTTLCSLEDERVQTIVAMVNQRRTLEEIGTAIGVTKERARQLVKKIQQQHGWAVLEPDQSLWSTKEAAAELGVTPAVVNRLCSRTDFGCQRRGARSWLINKGSLEALRSHLALATELICEICGTPLIRKVRARLFTCSDRCRTERIRRRYKAYYAGEVPIPASSHGWRKALEQQLQAHHIPADEEWLTPTAAAKRAGLSIHQLRWLRACAAVTTRTHPVKKRRTYAASEMEITRQVYEAHTKESSKEH